MLNCGDTFLTGEEDDQSLHLWIVLTPPIEGEVVIASVTTLRRMSETLVVLRPGDHPFLRHDSVISYAYSKITTVEAIETAILNGTAKLREPVSEAVLRRVRAGLLDSDFTPNGVRHYYRDVMRDAE